MSGLRSSPSTRRTQDGAMGLVVIGRKTIKKRMLKQLQAVKMELRR
jgi:hypothetical protein